jgi:hypothetical protein
MKFEQCSLFIKFGGKQEMKKQWIPIIIIVLIGLQIYSLIKIDYLQGRIEQSNNNTMQSVQNQIQSIYSNVDTQLKEQASIIKNASYQLGDIDIENLKVPITFEVTPKMIEQNTTVSLDNNGEIILLKKQNTTFSGTVTADIFGSVFPTIIIENDGVRQLEDHFGLCVGSIDAYIFPIIVPSFVGGTSYGSNEYTMNGDISFDIKSSESDVSFVDIQYVRKVDDKVISTQPIKKSEDGMFILKIDDITTLNKGQIFASYVVAKDSIGFRHEYLVEHYIAGEDEQREPYFEQKYIYASNGDLVFEFDENDLKQID